MESSALLEFSGILVVAVGTKFGSMKQKILFSDWRRAGMVFPMTGSTVEGDGGGGGHCTSSSFPQSFLAPCSAFWSLVGWFCGIEEEPRDSHRQAFSVSSGVRPAIWSLSLVSDSHGCKIAC